MTRAKPIRLNRGIDVCYVCRQQNRLCAPCRQYYCTNPGCEKFTTPCQHTPPDTTQQPPAAPMTEAQAVADA